MDTLMLLEQLASNAHFRVDIREIIKTQPSKIQQAFLTNDITQLKNELGDGTRLADRTTIFQI